MPKYLVAACAFLTCFASAGYAAQFGDFTYVEYDTTIEITDYPEGAVGEVVIPSEIVGKPVTSIGEEAFFSCGDLTSVTIPDSVTSIGINAFRFCISLTSVTLGSGVTSIGYLAFFNCSSLTAFVVDAANPAYSSVDGVLFDKNQTTLLEFPDGRAGAYAIPDSVTSIGEEAFRFCISLTNVTIPDSVTSIGDEAFTHCANLTNVTIPDSVNSIGNRAFFSCHSLTKVAIPDSVNSIGFVAFDKCSSLTAITVDAANPAYSSLDGVLFDKSQTTLMEFPHGRAGSYTIPDSVTSIHNWTFDGSSLTSVTLGSGITSIGDCAFFQCHSLTSVTIPDSVTSIGFAAFDECSSLTSVTIPGSVTSIGDHAYSECSSLNAIYFEGNAPILGEWVFWGADNLIVYYLPGTTGWGATFGRRPTEEISVLPVDPALEILQPPQSYTAAPGSSATFAVMTGGIDGESFEWTHGDTVVGEDSPTLTLSDVQASDAGQYTVTVIANGESVSSRAVTLGVKAPPYVTEKMMNISTRGQILEGFKVMIAGFVLDGSGQKDVLIRGIGPTLGQWMTGVCIDPKLTLFRNTSPATPAIAENEAWGSLTGDVPSITQRVGGFPLTDGSKDAVLYMNLDPGAYTAKVFGMDGTGVGLVELYDADLDPLTSSCDLSNISTRGEVGTKAQILIAGFVIAGEVPKQVLVRGIGPRLADFQVDGTLVDPYLRIVKNVGSDQLWVASNDNWSDNPNAADIVATGAAVGAFDLVDGSKDAVMLTWLEPGIYTAQVSGVDDGTGVALVEVYEVK